MRFLIRIAVVIAIVSPMLPAPPASADHGNWHCGEGIEVDSVEPADGSTVPNTAGIHIRARFLDTAPTCGIDSVYMSVDQTKVDYPLAYSSLNYYMVETNKVLQNGRHDVFVEVVEKCCRADGLKDRGWASWSFIVGDCGGAIVPDSQSPQGSTDDPRPWIVATFQDTTLCDLVDYGIEIDGQPVTVSKMSTGSRHSVYHDPKEDLAPGMHTVKAWVREECCNAAGTESYAETTWSFNYIGCGSTMTPQNTKPSGTWSGTTLQISATFLDESRTCGLDEWFIELDGVRYPASHTVHQSAYTVYADIGSDVAAGTHTARAYAREKCCSTSGSPAIGDVSWTFVAASCGVGITPTRYAPSGATGESSPVIEVVFQDSQRMCGLDSAKMTLDGAVVSPQVVEDPMSGTYTLRYRAPPLDPYVPHTVEASVTEKCCNENGNQDTATASWSFVVVDTSSAPDVCDFDEYLYGYISTPLIGPLPDPNSGGRSTRGGVSIDVFDPCRSGG